MPVMPLGRPEAEKPVLRIAGRIGRSIQHTIMLVVLLCVIVSTMVVGFVAYNRVRTGAVEEAKKTLVVEARLMSQRFRSIYSYMARDLKMLADMPPIQGIIRSSRNGGIDPLDGSTEELWRQRLATIFTSALRQRPNNFQLRYIGLADQGREIVRVDRTRDGAGSVVVPPQQLQQKGNEFYFKLGAVARSGRVVFSEVTFNREFGQRDPRNIPTMRGVLPIDDESGQRFGMLVINANYAAMLHDAFAAMRPYGHTFIINGQGDYMEHPGGIGREPLPLELHGAYTRTPPAIIGKVLDSTQDEEIFEDEQTVSFVINNDEGYGGFDDRVSIVIQVPKSELYAKANRAGMEVMMAGGIVILFFVIGSIFFARAVMIPLSRTAIAIVENVTDGLILVDRNGTIERFNPGCERIFGYASTEVIGKPVSMLMTPEKLERHKDTLLRYEQDGVCDLIGTTIEVEGVRKDGQEVPIEVSINQLNLNGRTKFSAIMRDISERREMERVKTEFVSTVSHELRTPLTSIRGSLGLVGKMIPAGLPGSVYQMIALAQKNTNRLITLVNDILDFEKLTSNEVKYEMETTIVQNELRQAAELIRGYADQFSVKIELDLPPQPLQIVIDISRFQQILANLLSNAVKFSPAFSSVTIKAVADGGNVRISVMDHGPGIPEEFQAQVFTPFSQADSTPARKIGGTGLGLSITRKLIEDMSGDVGFETKANEGTTFWMTFPLTVAEIVDVPTIRRADDIRLLGLHVEDDADFASVLAETFKDMILLRHAGDLASAKTCLQAERFDIIIIDVSLKDGNGLDLLDELPDNSHAAVAIVTALEGDYSDPRIDLVIIKSKTGAGEIQDKIMQLLLRQRQSMAAAARG